MYELDETTLRTGPGWTTFEVNGPRPSLCLRCGFPLDHWDEQGGGYKCNCMHCETFSVWSLQDGFVMIHWPPESSSLKLLLTEEI